MTRRTPLAVAATVAVTGLLTLSPSVARAQHVHGHVHGAVVVGGYYSPYFYSPFYGPFGWGYGWGPYAAYGPYGPYGYYGYPAEPSSSARIQVTPKDAGVYVDGYWAGKVDDFDGTFQRLNVRPGPHELTVFLEGYRTISEKVYMAEGSTIKIKETMQPLAPGEKSERPPAPPARRRAPRGHAEAESDPTTGQ